MVIRFNIDDLNSDFKFPDLILGNGPVGNGPVGWQYNGLSIPGIRKISLNGKLNVRAHELSVGLHNMCIKESFQDSSFDTGSHSFTYNFFTGTGSSSTGTIGYSNYPYWSSGSNLPFTTYGNFASYTGTFVQGTNGPIYERGRTGYELSRLRELYPFSIYTLGNMISIFDTVVLPDSNMHYTIFHMERDGTLYLIESGSVNQIGMPELACYLSARITEIKEMEQQYLI